MECLSVLRCSRIKVNGKLKPVQRGLFMALGMAVWVTPPTEEPQPAEGLKTRRIQNVWKKVVMSANSDHRTS